MKIIHLLRLTKIFTTLYLLPIFVFAAGPATDSVKIDNPLQVDSISDLLVAILEILIIIALPIIVLFIVYAGFLYVTARGNAEQVGQATRALTYAIIGGVIVLGAVAIATIIGDMVSSFRA